MALSKHTYFKRVSDPELYTVKSNESCIYVHDCMDFCFEENENKLKLIIYIDNLNYRRVPDEITPMEDDGIAKEYIYSNPINLKAELLDVEQYGFTLDDDIEIKEDKNEYGDIEGYTVTATLSYSRDTELKSVIWRITADNCSEWAGYLECGIYADYIMPTQKVDKTQNADPSLQLKRNMVNQSVKLANKIYDNGTAKTDQDVELSDIREDFKKSLITTNLEVIPDIIYDVFANAILEAVVGSNVDKYEPDKLEEQLYDQILNGLISGEKNIEYYGIMYRVRYSVTAMAGIGVGDCYVSWLDQNNKSHSQHLVWNTDQKTQAKLLSEYCTKLAELNKSLWKDFLTQYTLIIFDELDVAVKADDIEKVLDITEKVIIALNDKDAANELVSEMGDKVKNELTSTWWSGNKFKEYVEDNVPNGEDIVKASSKYEKVKKYHEELASLDKGSDEETIKKQFKKFKTAYDAYEKLVNAIG